MCVCIIYTISICLQPFPPPQSVSWFSSEGFHHSYHLVALSPLSVSEGKVRLIYMNRIVKFIIYIQISYLGTQHV